MLVWIIVRSFGEYVLSQLIVLIPLKLTHGDSIVISSRHIANMSERMFCKCLDYGSFDGRADHVRKAHPPGTQIGTNKSQHPTASSCRARI